MADGGRVAVCLENCHGVTAKPDPRAGAGRQAVAAARSKAGLYAQAAGVRLGAVIHIDDAGPEHGTIRAHRERGYAGGEPLPEDLAPGYVVVTAALIPGFSIARD